MWGLLKECVDGVVLNKIANLLNTSTDKAHVQLETTKH